MNTYLLLQNPGHNRVYYTNSENICLAEIEFFSKKADAEISNIQVKTIEGIKYFSFESNNELSKKDLNILSRLSFVFAIYKKIRIENANYLLPVAKINYEYIDGKISSLLKYQGKTNEIFTKMMINVAVLASGYSFEDKINLLDPIAGKGTTLYEGLTYGFNSYGIELSSNSVHEATIFFKKYLEKEKIKHTFVKRQIAGKNKRDAIYISDFEFSKTKQEFNDKKTKKFGIISGKTQDISNYFKQNFFNIIVGDLPYGIQHKNSKSSEKENTRNPYELLKISLPEWYKVLKNKGAIVISWNANVISKKKLTELFQTNKYEVIAENDNSTLEHLVDKAIKRDIIIAKKL